MYTKLVKQNLNNKTRSEDTEEGDEVAEGEENIRNSR